MFNGNNNSKEGYFSYNYFKILNFSSATLFTKLVIINVSLLILIRYRFTDVQYYKCRINIFSATTANKSSNSL